MAGPMNAADAGKYLAEFFEKAARRRHAKLLRDIRMMENVAKMAAAPPLEPEEDKPKQEDYVEW